MIPALVLTAGLATRLRPLSLVRAKAVLPIGGRPLVAHILARLAASGVTDAVLNLHHLPATVTRRIGDGTQFGLRVRYSWEFPAVLGSAGGPRKALPLIGARRFLIVNGDTLTDADIGAIVADHDASGALVTLAVVPNTSPHKYGGVTADADGRFTGVVTRGSTTPSLHFIGVQVVDADAFLRLADDTPAESIGSLYPQLARERRGAVRVYQCAASFLDIGTPGDYVASCRRMSTSPDVLECGTGVRIATGAQVTDSILWDQVTIGDGARVTSCLLTDGVAIPPGSHWHRKVIRRGDGPAVSGEDRIGDLLISEMPA
jgi:mannose-1-phosphate guanylyltransferase